MTENAVEEVERGEMTETVQGEVEKVDELTENVDEEADQVEWKSGDRKLEVDLRQIRLNRCLRKAIPENLAHGLLAHVMRRGSKPNCND